MSSLARRRTPRATLTARGIVVAYLGLVVVLPIALVFYRALEGGPGALWEALTDEEAVDAFRLTFIAAGITTLVGTLLGTATAFVLVRYRFPGRRLLDALVDLPLALPTSVTGLTLAAIFGPHSPVGAWLEARGCNILYQPSAVYVAFLVVTLPFVIRAVQPLLASVDHAEEEAAMTLGAGMWRRFTAIILPVIRPGILTGAALTFSRSLGEFGAVVFIAGTEPFRTQVASTLVYSRMENFDIRGASAAAVIVLLTSYLLLWSARKLERATTRRIA